MSWTLVECLFLRLWEDQHPLDFNKRTKTEQTEQGGGAEGHTTQQPLTVFGNRCCNGSLDAEPGISLAAGVGGECGAACSLHRALSHYCGMLGQAVGRWDREGLPLNNSEAGSGLLPGFKDTQKEHKAVFPHREAWRQVPPLRSQQLRVWEQVCVPGGRWMQTENPVLTSPALLFPSRGGGHLPCLLPGPSIYCPPSLGHRLQALPRDSHSFLEASTTTTTLPASYPLRRGDLPAKDRPALMLRGSWEELAPQQPHQACLPKPTSPTAH